MEYKEDDYLMLSGIQHFAFCRRQWALVHIDQLWDENLRTAEGELLHENCHDPEFTESRRDVIISRGMPVFSAELGISGECDVVEFRRASSGITLPGKDGKYTVFPVEYKHGEPKDSDIDILQLAAQAMCLEGMLACEIRQGAVYYGKTKKRLTAEITEELRTSVRDMLAEMHELMRRGYVPKVKPKKQCGACSLKNLCLPKLLTVKTASGYVRESICGDDGEVPDV